MKKYLHIVLKIVFSLILLLPVAGLLGILPPPTRELYNTDIAFAFIETLAETAYINYMMVVVHVAALIALWTRREALAALLMTPITANIIGFHAFLDGGLFTGGAILGNILLALNLYFLWQNRKIYSNLFARQ
jgi:hypothetical protein